ncbi:MAG TPA: hypothetical protein VLX90_20375 [Steroidobacteraceae bacterium]|nr:hypothetical protein [Steroidobacteraceae bacterium]
MEAPSTTAPAAGQPDASLVSYTNIIYALHSLSVLIGLTSAVTIVGSFVFGLPSIVAVIMNYMRRSEARGTYLESHFHWQIRTFWFALLWVIVIFAVSLPLMLVLVGFVTLWVGVVALGLWVIYRIVRGWLALRDQRPITP